MKISTLLIVVMLLLVPGYVSAQVCDATGDYVNPWTGSAGGDLDMLGNDIDNVATITDNSADPADSGVIRAGNNTAVLSCENSTPGTDSTLTCNTSNEWAASVGMKSPYLVSNASDPADSGVIRCGNNEVCIAAELATPGTDATISLDTSNVWVTTTPIKFGAEATGTIAAGQFITGGSDASVYYPTTFSQRHFLVGRSSLSGASSGSIYFGYHQSDNYGAMGVLSPGAAWRPLVYNLNAGADSAPFILGTNVELEWSSVGTSPTTQDVGIRRSSAGIVQITNGGTGYGSILASTTILRVGTKGAVTTQTGSEETLSCAGGGSATLVTSGLIPDGAFLIGITTRITTALTGSTGFSTGDGSDVDLYGVQAAATQGSTTKNSDATANWANPQLSAGEVTLTFAGGNCTAGAILVNAHYFTVTAATSN